MGVVRGLWPRVTPEGRPRLALSSLLSGLSEPTPKPAWPRSPRGPTPGRRAEPQRWPALGLQKTNDHKCSGNLRLCPTPCVLPDSPLTQTPRLLVPGHRGPAPSTFDSGSGKEEAKEISGCGKCEELPSMKMTALKQKSKILREEVTSFPNNWN